MIMLAFLILGAGTATIPFVSVVLIPHTYEKSNKNRKNNKAH